MPIQPNKYRPSFGIYKNTRITPYGKCTYGEYKKYHIQVYDDREDKAKLYYISDDKLKWVKSKLVFNILSITLSILDKSKFNVIEFVSSKPISLKTGIGVTITGTCKFNASTIE